MDGGLALRRRVNEAVIVDLREFGLGLLTITNIEVRGDCCMSHYAVDRRVSIYRKELFEAIERDAARTAQAR